MKVILFPGQGSQFKGMGKALFSTYPAQVKAASDILGYSIEELCLADPRNQLGQTDFTQPALYVVNSLCYDEKHGRDTAVDFLAGHSLGEYNALHAAGVFDFETGLRLVQKRGQLMAQAKGGGMLAVLQIKVDQIQALLRDHQLAALDIANYNTPTQTILSGPKDIIAKAETVFAENKVRCLPLNVSAPFHSRYMHEAMEEFRTFLSRFSFAPLKTPVIANVTARPYTDESVIQLLSSQIAGSVMWCESVRYLMGQAVLRKTEVSFHEMGDNPVLTRMVAEIRKTETPLLADPEPTPVAAVPSPLPAGRAEPGPVGGTNTALALAVQPEVTHEPAVLATPAPTQRAEASLKIDARVLGNAEFRKDYGLKYAYLTGAMYRAIASPQLVIALGKAGLMGFYGTGGLSLDEMKAGLAQIQGQLTAGQAYGVNLLCNIERPEMEQATVELLVAHKVRRIEAAAFMQITPALVWYRLTGLRKDAAGRVLCDHQVVAKISRPEVAEVFMSPAPERIVAKLLAEGKITSAQAEMAKSLPMTHDICVEADSGGHTDQGVSTVLLPAIQSLRTVLMQRFAYEKAIRIGLAGGIGTAQAVAAAFVMGADFVMTGSINQCTVESGASDAMKTMLQDINVQDTDYAPAGDMFEIGARVQVLRKGTFFPARANKLYMLYSHYGSLEEIPEKTRSQIEDKYFKKSFASIWDETKRHLQMRGRTQELQKAEANPKQKMAWVFRWYFRHSAMAALAGDEANRVDFQVHTGPALGAFNQSVKGTALESWKNRHVDQLADKLMSEAAELLSQRVAAWSAA